jgi:hypothetical protein
VPETKQILADGSKPGTQSCQSKAPVFIVGCPRSGTSFLYHLLLSAGGFAEFRTQMNVYDVLEPVYGDLGLLHNKKAALDEWLQSKAGRLSGLDPSQVERQILDNCHGAGDFLRIIMDAIAGNQGVERWIDSTPTNVPHMLRIHRDFPEALLVHIIRDPRDVALSLEKRGWSRPLPWDKNRSLLAAGLYWEWIVRTGRHLGSMLSPQYMEILYEDLVAKPKETLGAVGRFIGSELDYDRIRKQPVGSVNEPLTAFREDLQQGRFVPVGRWKEKFPPDQLQEFESLIGACMEEFGYSPKSSKAARALTPKLRAVRSIYVAFYPFKQWAKTHTPLSRWMVNYSEILIDK